MTGKSARGRGWSPCGTWRRMARSKCDDARHQDTDARSHSTSRSRPGTDEGKHHHHGPNTLRVMLGPDWAASRPHIVLRRTRSC